MKTYIFLIIFSFFFSVIGQANPITGQRASGVTQDDLQWNLYFNFPQCEHEGQKIGAWCTGADYSNAIRGNGVNAHLKSWIRNPKVKSIYMSYFSFSNRSIMKALCYETGKRDLNVKIYMDAGFGQTDGLLSNVERAEGSLLGREGYVPGCKERIYDQMEKRGSGGCCSDGYFLQHSKIFLALETDKIFDESSQLQDWMTSSPRIRFTSSSANMSGNGLALHFENWMFYNAPNKDYVALQNVCALWSFGQTHFYDNAEENIAKQRNEFKNAYVDCMNQVDSETSPQRDDMKFYMVPSIASNNRRGPSDALKKMLQENGNSHVKVAIHRLTTGAVLNPLFQSRQRGAEVSVLMDDDSLRSSLDGAGSGLDVNFLDANTYRKLARQDIEVNFVETNGDSFRHLFHNKFIVGDDKILFQGAGNFTATALNAYGRDGSYEQFYVIKNPEIVKAYVNGWDYLRSIASSKEQHPHGDKPDNCAIFGEGLPQLVPCGVEGAETY